MSRKGSKGKGRLNKNTVVEMLVEMFNRNDGKMMSPKEIFKELGLTTTSARTLCVQILDDMVFDGYLVEPEFRRYRLANNVSTLVGTFSRNKDGYNEFYPEDGSDPVLISERNSAHALTDDIVRVALFARRRGRGREGEVIEIIKRTHDTFVGELHVEKHYAFLITESRIMPNDIFIPKDLLKGGKNGEKAVVKLLEWPLDSKNPVGKVLDILGKSGDNDTEMNAILAEYGLPYNYPIAVEQAAAKLPSDITAEEIASRRDFRDTTTFTIDPVDAKDFDDALSIKSAGEGLWEIGVHIADVSHYVTEGSIIDKEAFKRATSIYLVDRTIPMLPEHLCNFLCSLRPNEEKLTYSVVFTMNEKAEVKKYEITRGVIKSDRRFSYEEAQEIIEKGEGEYSEEIKTLNMLAQKMRAKRFHSGAIDFQQAQVHFRLDEKGKPLSVYFSESNESHQLIEEFMLLANRTVAERIGRKTPGNTPKTFVYRIHDQPNPEKLSMLSKFVTKLGYKMKSPSGRSTSASALNHLLKDIHGTKEQNVIEQISLRTMQKYVEPVFEAAELNVIGEESESVKFELMYAFLMERFEYTLETSITPAYSLLCHGVGDSKTFAMVYSTMCRRADVECRIVSGTKNGEAWYWNLICEDGVYYHVDLLSPSGFIKYSDAQMGAYVWDYSAYPACGVAGRTNND